MRTLTRTLLAAALVSSIAVLGLQPVARAQDSSAVAINTKDGRSVFKLAFSVKKTMNQDVDAQNAAVAYASCNDCKTVAASIQVVLASNAESVEPENIALAINYQCTDCETLAAAYQFVFASGSDIRFTDEGKRRLHDIKKRFHDLKKRTDLTLEELAQEIAKLAGETAMVVDEEVELKKALDSQTSTTSTSSPPESTSTTARDDSTTTTS